MKAGLVRFGGALTACLSAFTLAGCMSLGGPGGAAPRGPGSAHSPGGQALAPGEARAQLQPGVSSKQEVAAALGTAVVVRFDSGHEVWVYRWPGADGTPQDTTELVLLFPPEGPLARLRMRPGGSPAPKPGTGSAQKPAD